MRNNCKRFDNQLIDAIKRCSWFYNKKSITIEKSGRGFFSFTPMLTSLHLFFYIFAKHIIHNLCDSTIEISVDKEWMQILSPEGESFNNFPEEEQKLINVILKENRLQMSFESDMSTITITRS